MGEGGSTLGGSSVYTADSTGCEDFDSSEMGDGHGGGDGGAAGEFLYVAGIKSTHDSKKRKSS